MAETSRGLRANAGADFRVPGQLRLARFRRPPVDRLGVVATDLLAYGEDEGIEAALVLALRERRREWASRSWRARASGITPSSP